MTLMYNTFKKCFVFAVFKFQNWSGRNIIWIICKNISYAYFLVLWIFIVVIFLVDEKCEKKVVTPLEVALLQLKHVIIIPLSSLGTGTGQFMSELWSKYV